MKSTSITLLATLAFTLTSFAAPALLIETTITDGNNRVMSRPSVIVASGKQATISTGNLDSQLTYALTPTLLENGTVDMRTFITQRNGKKTDKLQIPRMIVPLGQTAQMKVGEFVFAVKPSRMK